MKKLLLPLLLFWSVACSKSNLEVEHCPESFTITCAKNDVTGDLEVNTLILDETIEYISEDSLDIELSLQFEGFPAKLEYDLPVGDIQSIDATVYHSGYNINTALCHEEDDKLKTLFEDNTDNGIRPDMDKGKIVYHVKLSNN